MTFLTEPFRARTWREQAWALAAFALGTFWFCVLVTLLATGASLTITLVGLPLLALTLWLAGAGARVERAWARVALGVEVAAPPEPARREEPALRHFLRSLIRTDRWRAVLYLLLLFPLGIVEFTVAVTLWSCAFAGITAPIWVPFEARADRPELGAGRHVGDHAWHYVVSVAVGVLLLLVTPWIVRGLVRLHAAVLRALLGPTRGELERAAIAEQRDHAVATVGRQARDIERDLHDGAQARLVALAVDLDRARTRLEQGAPPEEAAALVRSAHEEAKTALVEIRDLARGIHPAILEDRGLDAAVSALAARAPVPLRVEVSVPSRPPAEVEAAAYYVVSEALANLARHSGATRGSVGVVASDGRLDVFVSDDGRGGVDEADGSGLAGLRERVSSLGGGLGVVSPPGGGTTVHAWLPCG
jgi:signal transduction histidine kinase